MVEELFLMTRLGEWSGAAHSSYGLIVVFVSMHDRLNKIDRNKSVGSAEHLLVSERISASFWILIRYASHSLRVRHLGKLAALC